MESIDIEEIKAAGYVEDKESKRRFEAQCFRENLVFVVGFLSGLIYVVVAHNLSGLWISAVSCCACLLNVWRQYNAPMIERATAQPMLKFKNAHPDKCVILELIYVCRERRMYFRRIWVRVGEF